MGIIVVLLDSCHQPSLCLFVLFENANSVCRGQHSRMHCFSKLQKTFLSDVWDDLNIKIYFYCNTYDFTLLKHYKYISKYIFKTFFMENILLVIKPDFTNTIS